MTEPIHPRMQLLIDAMPLPGQISVRNAATILGRTEMEVLDLVADGQIMSWTHSPLEEQLRHINCKTKEEKWLPRITPETDPWTVWLDGPDVAWWCCVQFECLMHAPEDPPKEAIEARLQYAIDQARMHQPPTPVAQPEAVLMPAHPMPAAVAESWHIKKPDRAKGYNLELYSVLKAAKDAGKTCPKAREVLDSWAASKPPGILEVMSDEFKYLDSSGNAKTAYLNALRKAIGRMTSARQEADKPDKRPISPTRGR